MAAFAACVSAGFAADIFVDGVAGVDTNNGLTPATAVKTIAKGIELVGENETVTVAAATYTEKVALNKAGVKLLGPNATKLGYATDRAPEAIISGVDTNAAAPSVHVTGLGAKFAGFKVENVTSTEVHGGGNDFTALIYGSAVSNAIVANNIVIGQPDDAGKGPNGICFSGAGAAIAEGNLVKDVLTVNRSGIKLQSCLASKAIKNKVINIQYNGIATDASSGGMMDGNITENCGQGGLQVANTGLEGSYTVTNNIVKNTNTINAAGRGGLAITSNAYNVTISHNKFTGNKVAAIGFRDGTADIGTATVVGNSFLGNDLGGIYMGRSGSILANGNFWNAAGGPAATGADAVKLGPNGGTVTAVSFAAEEFPDATVAEWPRF